MSPNGDKALLLIRVLYAVSFSRDTAATKGATQKPCSTACPGLHLLLCRQVGGSGGGGFAKQGVHFFPYYVLAMSPNGDMALLLIRVLYAVSFSRATAATKKSFPTKAQRTLSFILPMPVIILFYF
jgi:hypothetical protein